MTDIRDEAAAGFEDVFGYAPNGIWSAPGRVNLIGEHTDYNDGFVLPFAIDRRTVVAVGTRDADVARVASSYTDELVEIPLAELNPEHLTGWSAYPLGVAWSLAQFGADLAAVPGLDIFIVSDVPVGAGLSSSHALESAVALALNDLWQLGLDRQTLARVAQVTENQVVGAPTGIMDQSASLLGEKDCAVFLDCRSLDYRIIPLGLEAADLAVLIIDTGVKHEHANGGYAERRASCELGAKLMGVGSLRDLTIDDLPRAREVLDDVTFRRVRHVITENQRVLDTVAALESAGPRSIGELLDASHRSMRDDFEISVMELDLAVETAIENGAVGARMTGGGFGGSAIALVAREDVSRIQVAVDGAFAEHGLGIPDTFVVVPSKGAVRDR
ncbi:MAG: galactokinase [Actinomycetota bacterium]|jgi:galactokinase|nr:galactokinase [Actinomycetota bacterium]